MAKKINPYSFRSRIKHFRSLLEQFIVPIAIFQGIRTIFFPSTFDVILLAALIILAAAVYLEWF